MDSDTVIGFVILAAITWYLIPKPWQDRKETNRIQAELERSRTGQPGQRERSFFKSCTNCGVFALTLPFRDALGRTYCSGECMSWLAGGGKVFCPQCLGETSVETAGDVVTHWSVGKHFGQPERPCGECDVRSVERSVAFYRLLGFEEGNRHTPEGQAEPVWVWLRSGGAQLVPSEARSMPRAASSAWKTRTDTYS